jgi:hypothetical protein
MLHRQELIGSEVELQATDVTIDISSTWKIRAVHLSEVFWCFTIVWIPPD